MEDRCDRYLDAGDMLRISDLLKRIQDNSSALEYSKTFELLASAMCSDDYIVYNSRDDVVEFSHGY